MSFDIWEQSYTLPQCDIKGFVLVSECVLVTLNVNGDYDNDDILLPLPRIFLFVTVA